MRFVKHKDSHASKLQFFSRLFIIIILEKMVDAH